MKKLIPGISLTFCVLVFSPSLLSKPQHVGLEFESLALKNGKPLSAGVIRSYDPETGKVVVFAEKQIASLQLELLPDAVQQRILELVPSEEKDARRSSRERHETSMREDSRRREQRAATVAQREAKKEAQQTAQQAQERSQQLRESLVAASRRAATQRANRYYRYEMKPGSGASIVVRSDIEIREPEEVAGWENRFRVRGSVGIEYYDSKGSSFGTRTHEFEVLLQGDARGQVEVVDFSPK